MEESSERPRRGRQVIEWYMQCVDLEWEDGVMYLMILLVADLMEYAQELGIPWEEVSRQAGWHRNSALLIERSGPE